MAADPAARPAGRSAKQDYYAEQSQAHDDGDPRVRHVRHADSVDRRDVRRDEHDVRGGRLSHARDRHAARARLLAAASIVTAFLAESIALALIGGVIGCLLALPVHGLSTGTTNFASFSEVAFKFRITPALLAGGLVFAALMGAAGGLLPAHSRGPDSCRPCASRDLT